MPSKAMTLETTRRALEEMLLPAGAEAIPIRLIASEKDPALEALSEAERSWVEAQDWSGKQGSVLVLPDGRGGIGAVLLGTGGKDWPAQAPLLTGVLAGAPPIDVSSSSTFFWLAASWPLLSSRYFCQAAIALSFSLLRLYM